jgi:hypothetical protein
VVSAGRVVKCAKKRVIRGSIPGQGQPPPSGGTVGAALDFGCLEHPPKRIFKTVDRYPPPILQQLSRRTAAATSEFGKLQKKITFFYVFFVFFSRLIKAKRIPNRVYMRVRENDFPKNIVRSFI